MSYGDWFVQLWPPVNISLAQLLHRDLIEIGPVNEVRPTHRQSSPLLRADFMLFVGICMFLCSMAQPVVVGERSYSPVQVNLLQESTRLRLDVPWNGSTMTNATITRWAAAVALAGAFLALLSPVFSGP